MGNSGSGAGLPITKRLAVSIPTPSVHTVEFSLDKTLNPILCPGSETLVHERVESAQSGEKARRMHVSDI